MGLGFFSPRRILTGMILTAFVITPTILDPVNTFNIISEFFSKLGGF